MLVTIKAFVASIVVDLLWFTPTILLSADGLIDITYGLFRFVVCLFIFIQCNGQNSVQNIPFFLYIFHIQLLSEVCKNLPNKTH